MAQQAPENKETTIGYLKRDEIESLNIEKENFPVKGELIIAIPARDLVLITGSDDSENLENVKTKVKEINETGDHVVSDRHFILKNDKFETYE